MLVRLENAAKLINRRLDLYYHSFPTDSIAFRSIALAVDSDAPKVIDLVLKFLFCYCYSKELRF